MPAGGGTGTCLSSQHLRGCDKGDDYELKASHDLSWERCQCQLMSPFLHETLEESLVTKLGGSSSDISLTVSKVNPGLI